MPKARQLPANSHIRDFGKRAFEGCGGQCTRPARRCYRSSRMRSLALRFFASSIKARAGGASYVCDRGTAPMTAETQWLSRDFTLAVPGLRGMRPRLVPRRRPGAQRRSCIPVGGLGARRESPR